MIQFKSLLIILTFGVLVLAEGAEKYEDTTLKVTLDIPESFTKLPTDTSDNEFLGTVKSIYIDSDVATTGGAFLVHHMKIPSTSTDYDDFKKKLSGNLKMYYGDGYKEVKQEDLKGDHKGFMLEYHCMGGDQGPDPNGTIPLQVRWYLVKAPDDKLHGFIYISRRDNWKEMEPKFEKSFKSLKI